MLDEKFFLRLRAALDDAGIQVADIARRTEFSRGAVYKYLGGQDPPLSFVVAFCQEAQVDIGWLTVGAPPPMSPDTQTGSLCRTIVDFVEANGPVVDKLIAKLISEEVYVHIADIIEDTPQ